MSLQTLVLVIGIIGVSLYLIIKNADSILKAYEKLEATKQRIKKKREEKNDKEEK